MDLREVKRKVIMNWEKHKQTMEYGEFDEEWTLKNVKEYLDEIN